MLSATARTDRRQRLFDAMAAHQLDVLVLGRPADVRFATGAEQLWTAGNRPFGPACVAVAATGRTHLLSTWDEGMPPEVGHDDLFGLSWNPANLMASLAKIPGMREARRVGTGSLSPGFPRMMQALAPDAELVDGTAAIWAARWAKSAEEIGAVHRATAAAEAALAAVVAALHPGVTETELRAVYLEHIALAGAPTPPSDRIAEIDGDRVALDLGVIIDGYEGGAGGTWSTSGERLLDPRCQEGLDAVVRACRPGAAGAEVRQAWPDGELLVHGLGLGVEPPIITAATGGTATLAAGMVLSVTARLDGFLERTITEVRP